MILEDPELNRSYVRTLVIVENLLATDELRHLAGHFPNLPDGLIFAEPNHTDIDWEQGLDSQMLSLLSEIEKAFIVNGERTHDIPWLASIVIDAEEAIETYTKAKAESNITFLSSLEESLVLKNQNPEKSAPHPMDLVIGELSDFFGSMAGQYNIVRFAKQRGYKAEDLEGSNKAEIVAQLMRDALEYGIDEMIGLARSLRRIHKLSVQEENEFERILERATRIRLEDKKPTDGMAPGISEEEGAVATSEPRDFDYDVAITFAGEDRDKARQLAKELLVLGIRVFYDELYKSQLWGKELIQHFQEVYGPKTRYVLVLISKHYPIKDWTDFEFSIARKEAPKRKEEFILPVRLNETKILGIHEDVSFLRFEKEGAKGIAEMLLQKLNMRRPKRKEDIFVASIGVELSELAERGIIGKEDLEKYSDTCDRLEDDLKTRLVNSSIGNYIFPEPSLRDGEGLTIRFAFKWNLAKGIPEVKGLEYWNMMEFRLVEEVYPENYLEIVRSLTEKEK